MDFNIELGKQFALQYMNYPDSDKFKIREFILHFQKNGWNGLKGKNKPSWDVPVHDPEYEDKVSYAKRNKLWHYHIGIPKYITSNCGAYLTSEYVAHYMRFNHSHIKIVDMAYHPPMVLPGEDYLN